MWEKRRSGLGVPVGVAMLRPTPREDNTLRHHSDPGLPEGELWTALGATALKARERWSLSADEMGKRVVVDADAGTDDAVALLLLLTAEPERDFRVVGITCTYGNTTLDNVCRNVLTTLESVNRLDVPVFKGAEGPLVPLHDPNIVVGDFHGKDGFGDKDLPPPRGEVQPENAVAALERLARENEGIVLICLGPLTNVALALRTYPEFSRNLEEVYLMGGNWRGVGNSTPSAEFNFHKDPEAAHIVLSTLACPITVLPWEGCNNDNLTLEERFRELGASEGPHMRLLNAIERDLYTGTAWTPCDALLLSAFLDEAAIKRSRNAHLAVELHGVYTRGQGVVDHLGMKKPNVRLVEEIELAAFKRLVSKMASFAPEP